MARRWRSSGRVYSTVLSLALILLFTNCARQDYADRSTLHLPVYPHANAIAPTAKQRGEEIVEVFTTWDTFDNVRDWYTSTLPRGTQSVVNEVKRQATYALFDDRRRSVHLEVAGGQVYIYLTGIKNK